MVEQFLCVAPFCANLQSSPCKIDKSGFVVYRVNFCDILPYVLQSSFSYI